MSKRKPRAVSPFAPDTLGEWLVYLGANLQDASWRPVWPPDAFAIGAALLRRTGGYVDLVNGPGDRERLALPTGKTIEEAGSQWRGDLEELFEGSSRSRTMRDICPLEIKKAWSVMRSQLPTPLATARDNPALTAAAVTLCTVSDQACDGLGIWTGSKFLAVAEQLAEHNARHSYCWEISPAKLAVLGKQHTPQRGCSIRSLTHNLSLYTPTEIRAVWPAPVSRTQDAVDVFNILLLPWPTMVGDGDFRAKPADPVFRYFDYQPPTGVDTAARVARAMDVAESRVEHVHAVVLPELALDEREYDAVEKRVAMRRAMLVSGVRKAPSDRTNQLPSNTCAMQPYGLTIASDARFNAAGLKSLRRTQFKHHRWCLDRGQIMQYNLGGRLPASRDCWETHYIGPREVHFVTLTTWLTISTLICEDLARQEPVTEVLRAVGPNLIFALLMDGPQLKSRWSSRYASVLAEDPGCSVLTLTSLGMSRRSQAADAATDRSHTVALWRDAIYGEREISVRPGEDACILSLVCQTNEEYTIDGRGDGGCAYFPVFSGSTSFAVPDAPRRRRRARVR